MVDLTVENDVVAYMKGATTESDWNTRCDEVKRANKGYPAFWYSAIVLSGVAAQTFQGWR